MRFNPTVTEVARHFAEYINRVAYRGERFVLMRGKRPVAELRPVASGKRLRELPDLLFSLPHLSKEDLEGMAADLEQAREKISRNPVRDPWAS
ncbi:MAG: type II toxin-antitoxin system Phd/YefM family antitoxin [Gemmatimonadota bacterium]|nr:type II toxin-antitoxin system Phd/YefM family antitoxin [Gemmatimonadota bacterium]